MKKKNKTERDILIQAAKDAINAVADDKSVELEASVEDMGELQWWVECCIEGLKNDIQNRE